MSKIKIINPSTDAIARIIRSDFMLATGEYETVKKNPSIIDDTSTHVL